MECILCHGQATDRHHIFGGANRQLSEKYGLTVYLCRNCHREVHDHPNQGADLCLKRIGQKMFERDHDREDFRRIFERDYLG